MLIDLRAHIASLVAVFLALGLGILIGTTFVGSPSLFKRQLVLVQQLQSEFSSLRQNNVRLKDEVATLSARLAEAEAFARTAVPALVAGRLTGVRVGVVVTRDGGYPLGPVRQVLQEAGAQLASVTTLVTGVAPSRGALDQLQGALGVSGGDTAQLYTDLADRVAQVLALGEQGHSLRALARTGLVRFQGDFSQPVQAVLLIGGRTSRQDEHVVDFDLPLIAALKQASVTVVGAEDTRVAVSTVPAYQSEEVATVDDLDTPAGQVAMVAGLAGEVGNWGVKQGASALLPPLSPTPAGG